MAAAHEALTATGMRAADAPPVVPTAAPAATPGGRALTDREVQVVRLLASGLTNNDIAEQLVLSVRTVERHISNIYGKLGLRGRPGDCVCLYQRPCLADLAAFPWGKRLRVSRHDALPRELSPVRKMGAYADGSAQARA